MNKKRLDIISKYFWPADAGIEVNIKETYKILAKKWDITIHTSTDTLRERNILPQSEQILGIKVKRYRFSKLGYFPKVNWNKTDIICLHNFNVFYFPIFLYIGLLKLIGKQRFAVIVTPHGGFTPEWSIYPKLMVLFKRTYHFTIGTYFLNHFVDRIRAVSEWERQEIIKCGVDPNKVVVISNGLEDEAYQDLEKLASSKIKKLVKSLGRYLIQVGRIYVIKNYETTIKALAMAPKDVKFVIVGAVEGSSEYLRELKRLIKELGLTKRVIFVGIVRGVDKYYLMKHAEMMVHMALWESFCNVVHEGMSQGLVCLVANNTALPLLIKNGRNGYTIRTKDSAALAEKINYVLARKNTREIKMIKSRNRQIGLQVTWSEVARKMHNLYLKEVNKNAQEN